MKKNNIIWLSALIIMLSCEDKQKTAYHITFNVSEIDFGRVEVDTESDSSIIITNSTKSSGVFIGIINIMDMSEVSFNGTKNITLEKGESISIPLTFVPISVKDYSGRFTVIEESRNPDYFYELPIKGVGVRPVIFSLSTDILQFDLVDIGSYKEIDLTIENSSFSGFDLEITLSGISGDFSLPLGILDFTIPPGTSEIVPVRYTPSGDNSTTVLSISHNSTLNVNPITIAISGTKDESKDIETSIQNGWSSFEAGNFADALISFQESIETANANVLYDSLHAEILNGSGWANAFIREYSAAAIDFNKVQNYSPAAITKLDAVAGIVLVENIRGKYTVVIDQATELLNSDPNYIFSHNTTINHADIRLARAQAYFNSGDFINCALDLDVLDPNNKPHSLDPAKLIEFLQVISGGLQ